MRSGAQRGVADRPRRPGGGGRGAGWDGFFLWDHLHLRREGRWDVHDPWVLFGAMAHATERVVLGAARHAAGPPPPVEGGQGGRHPRPPEHGRAVSASASGRRPTTSSPPSANRSTPRAHADLLDEGLDVVAGLLRRALHLRRRALQRRRRVPPGPVQRPRPPIWVAGYWPNRRPLRRAARWDGVMPPAGRQRGHHARGAGRRRWPSPAPAPGFDVVASWAPDTEPADYAAAGATWLVDRARHGSTAGTPSSTASSAPAPPRSGSRCAS